MGTFVTRSLLLSGRHHHDHLAPFHLRALLDRGDVVQVLLDALEQDPTELAVGHFTPAETDRDLGLVAVFEKTAQIAHLHLVIALFGTGAELDLFDLNLFLLLLCGLGLLGLFELELAVVHDAADRRVRVGHDLDEIEARVQGRLLSFCVRYDADVLAFRVNQPNLGDTNVLVQACVFSSADASILQNRAAAARDLLDKACCQRVDRHAAQILAGSRAHGHCLRFNFAVADHQQVRDAL